MECGYVVKGVSCSAKDLTPSRIGRGAGTGEPPKSYDKITAHKGRYGKLAPLFAAWRQRSVTVARQLFFGVVLCKHCSLRGGYECYVCPFAG